MRVVFSFCSLIVFLPASTRGTAIVAVRFPGGILVLADSKPTYLRSDVNKSVCKIIPVKNAYVAVSGMVRDTSREFDAEQIAARAFDSPDRFEVHVRHATELIRAEATRELLRLRREDQEQYGFALKNRGNPIDVLFVAFEKHVAMLAARRLRWNEGKLTLELLQKQDCPGSACPNGTYLSKIGEVSEIEKFLKGHKNPELSETNLRDLMVQQAQATPNDVGLPIQVLALQESGPTWLANDLGCPLQK
jgi:hypothetical protein